MGMKRVRIQAGLLIPEFLQQYGTGAQCKVVLMADVEDERQTDSRTELDHDVLGGGS